jgi:uncharacterized protein YkwD
MRGRGWATLLFGALGLAACQSSAPGSVAELRPQPTYTLLPTYTPQPTPTRYPIQPTYTALPTYTPQPTPTISPSATVAVAETVAADALSVDGLVAQMLDALNLRRGAERCPPVALEPRLAASAQGHADEIAARREVSHRSADGSTLEQRLERVGYPFQRRSETIAVSSDASAEAVVDRWLDEPLDGPHRSSVMNCLYQDVGIGVAWTDAGIIYWVVDYGQPSP